MHKHSARKIKKLIALRKKGYSINELVERIGMPKTSVWHHIRSVRVLSKYALELKSKRGGSAKRRRENLAKARILAQELLQGPQREKIIALAMLYWAEGSKRGCEFINSDGSMIRLYLDILDRVFGIPATAIKPTIRIFTGMDRNECLDFWSNVTKIPEKCFEIYFNDGGTSGRTRYGLCRITVKKGGQTLKLLQALIEQIKQEM